MTCPAPWQDGQVRSIVKKPCCARTRPLPSQVGQVDRLGAGLGAAAVASVAEHRVGDVDGRLFAAKASSSEISRL